MPVTILYPCQPALILTNMPIFPSRIPSSLAGVRRASRISHYFNNGYSSISRGGTLVSLSFNNPITSDAWMHYYSACYRVLAATANPNVRPTNE